MSRKLRRNMEKKVFGGVCAGIADFFDLDVRLVRGAFVIGALMGSLGFWIYAVLTIVIPEDDRLDY